MLHTKIFTFAFDHFRFLEVLDPALLRPGRFDLVIDVPQPISAALFREGETRQFDQRGANGLNHRRIERIATREYCQPGGDPGRSTGTQTGRH